MYTCETKEINLNQKNIDTFWSKVVTGKTDDCWLWSGSRDAQQYGDIRIGKKLMRAHRVSWTIRNGQIPNGIFVLHRCDNPSCVNPSHLFLGTIQDNHADMCKKGRIASGDNHGLRIHPERAATGLRNGAHTKPEQRRHGESHGMAIVTDEIVLAMRSLRSNQNLSYTKIGKQFSLSKASAREAIIGKTWTHIPL